MRRLILATALAAASSPAVAQTAAELLPPRSVADPAREVAAPEAPGRAGPIAPGQAAGPGFVLKGVTVTGASVIPPAELAPIWRRPCLIDSGDADADWRAGIDAMLR